MMPEANARSYSSRVKQELIQVVNDLKLMRNYKYYESLGCESFEEYLDATFTGSKHALLALLEESVRR